MGEGSSQHHFEGRPNLVTEDMKMVCKKAYKARHGGYEQAGLPGRGSGSEGRGDEAISWRKPSEEGPQR